MMLTCSQVVAMAPTAAVSGAPAARAVDTVDSNSPTEVLLRAIGIRTRVRVRARARARARAASGDQDAVLASFLFSASSYLREPSGLLKTPVWRDTHSHTLCGRQDTGSWRRMGTS